MAESSAHRAICVLAALAFVPAMFGQGGPPERPQRGVRNIQPAPDTAAVERGQKVFSSTCGFCHGRDASGGDGGPDLIRSGLVNHDEHGDAVGPVILNGRPDKGMPPFKQMTTEQISDIAAFLHGRIRDIRYRQLYHVKKFVGDTKAGEAYFTGTARCNSCHSISGDLNHIASKYEPEVLLGRMLYPAPQRSGASPRTQITVTVTLASGRSFAGPLTHLDEFTVSMSDAAGNYHTWDRQGLTVDVHDPLAAHLEFLEHVTDDQMHSVMAYLETLK
jgi:cytochrome c oxidase cbb3-type subunit III